MEKNSQLYSQIFIYILTMILIAFILIYGYNSIRDFRNRAEQVACLKFKKDLTSAIELISYEFGSVKTKEFQLCGNYKKICFVETYGHPSIPNNVDPIIKDSILSNAGKNVFLIEEITKESFYAGKISVNPKDSSGVLCINSKENKIILRIEGMGDHALLSE